MFCNLVTKLIIITISIYPGISYAMNASGIFSVFQLWAYGPMSSGATAVLIKRFI